MENIIAVGMAAMSGRCCGSSCDSKRQAVNETSDADDPEYTAVWEQIEEDVQDSYEAYLAGSRDCFFGNHSSIAYNSCEARQKRKTRASRQALELKFRDRAQEMEAKAEEMRRTFIGK